MTRLLLIGINARYTHSNPAIRYLRNFCRALPVQIELIEFSINQSTDEMLAAIHTSSPDLAAFSVYIWNSRIIATLLPDIRKILPDTRLILGGPEVSYQPDFWLTRHPEIDNIICGAGEGALYDLLSSPEYPRTKIIPARPVPFELIPFPYLKEDFPDLNNKYIYYEASRGCPFRCSYCLSSREDQQLETRSWDKIRQELEELNRRDIRIVKFVDRSFNARAETARLIWEYLLNGDNQIKYHFEINAELLEDEDFAILARVPPEKFQFEIGIQSTNPATLQEVNRPVNWQKLSVNIRKVIALRNIRVHVDLLAGLPYDDYASICRAIDQVWSLEADYLQLGFLKVLSGTRIHEKAEDYQLLFQASPPYEILSNRWLDFSELRRLKGIETAINLLYNSGNFLRTLQETGRFYRSPVTFLERFTEFSRQIGTENGKLQWWDAASLLIEFLKSEFPGTAELWTDLLRWDWCQLANSHYYPELLASTELIEVKKRYYSDLKRIIDTEPLYSGRDCRQAIFFTTENDILKKKLLEGNQVAAFLGRVRHKSIIYLN
ncbi:MAG: DUF4080 domain-containing protein [Candidatus Cloacimonetes bacterium]|nr:DUF4080 domain-containing protein [Candidatus Cloacimonadota bacterium]